MACLPKKDLPRETIATVAKSVATDIQDNSACRDNRNCRKGQNENSESLHRKLNYLKVLFQACLKVRNSSDHKNFSQMTLHHEAMAFERLWKRMSEIQAMLNSMDC